MHHESTRKASDPTASVSWAGRLAQARSHADVVGVARDFLAMISPEEMSLLPGDCRPGKLVDGEDIANYAVTLARRSCTKANLGDPNLQRIAAFLSEALARIAQINAAQDSPSLQ